MGFAILAVLAVFCSCQTAPVVWDDSCPQEQSATVRFLNMQMESYNGIAVSKFYFVAIPSGEAHLGGDVNIYRGDVLFKCKGMEWDFVFEAGKEYTMLGAARDMKWGVVVYDLVNNRVLDKEHELAFIPFQNQPRFTN
jgi:hypothetical protein